MKEWFKEHKLEIFVGGLAVASWSLGMILGGYIVNEEYNLIFDTMAEFDKCIAFTNTKTGKTVFIRAEESLKSIAL